MTPHRGHRPAGRGGTTAAGLLLVTVAALTGTTLVTGAIAAVPVLQQGGTAAAAVTGAYALSAATVAAAVAALSDPRTWAVHLLGVGLFAAAAGFNTHAVAATVRVIEVLALPMVGLYRLLLPALAAALVVLAVVDELTPGGDGAARQPVTERARAVVLVAIAAFAATAVLPPSAVGVLFLGALTPAVALVCLLGGPRQLSLAAARARARPLLALLTASLVVLAALAATAAVPWLVSLAANRPAATAGSDGILTLPLWTAQLGVLALAVVIRQQGDAEQARLERRVTHAAAVAVVAALGTAGFVLLTYGADLITDSRPAGRAVAVPIATAIPVALALLPLYTATLAALDRLLYGTRPTPYSVLAGIATASRADPVDAPDLDRLVHDVATGLGAGSCRLTVRRPGLPDRVHRWPTTTGNAAGDRDRTAPAVEVDIRHAGEIVGSLAVDDTALSGPQPQQRRELLADVADSLGVVLQASRAGVALEQQLRAAITYANDIATTRRELVAAMDRERRRIERDLHDGVQHHLGCLRITLGLVDHQLATNQLNPARTRLDQFLEGLDVAEAVLDETAQGVTSPLLAELGLVQALGTSIGGGDPPLTVDAAPDLDDGLLPYPTAAAVYYCCLEATGNARKHTPSATITVRLRRDGDWLRVSVVDDGIGWDTTKPNPEGRGLRNVAARIGSVGGHLAISSTPGHGTTVEASVPLPGLAFAQAPDPAQPISDGHPLAARASAPPARLPALVWEALRTARESYHRTPYAPWLRILAERLEGPPHIAVRAAPDVALAGALRAGHPALKVIELCTADSEHAGVHDPTAGAAAVLEATRALADQAGHSDEAIDYTCSDPGTPRSSHRTANTQLPHERAGWTPETTRASTIVVVNQPVGTGRTSDEPTPDDHSAAASSSPTVRVDIHMATAAQNMTPTHYDRLRRRVQQHPDPRAAQSPPPRSGRPPRPPPREAPALNGDAGRKQEDNDERVSRTAIGLIRSKRATNHTTLAEQLAALSGLNQLVTLLEARVAGCWDAAAARAVLVELEQLVRADPPARGADQLWWQLERIRATSHELAELELVEQLRGGQLPVPPGTDRGQVLRLLGVDGADPRVRLGLPADADPDQVRAAAAQQREWWQLLAAHPATTRALRTLADTLTRTCELLESPDRQRDPGAHAWL